MVSTRQDFMSNLADWLSSSAISDTREELVLFAKLAEQAERYDEMAAAIKVVAERGQELTREEMNLLSVAYKNLIGELRTAWRVVAGAEIKADANDASESKQQTAKKFRMRIEKQLNTICGEVQSLLDDHLLKNVASDEAMVFYYKMKGDYHRYLAEVAMGDEHNAAKESSEEAYEVAEKLADEKLEPSHPVRLGLALNYSVFLFEIKSDYKAAGEMAKKAFDKALPGLKTLPEDTYNDSSLILQLLRDNLTLWTSEQFGDDTD